MPRDPKDRLPADRLPADRLIVALDVDSLDRATGLVDALAGQVTRFKIGSQLFTAEGPRTVEAVRERGGEVFLDLKFHDIPNTVEGAAREAVRLGVFMFNVHASGGRAMMRAACHGAADAAHALGLRRPLVIAVTVLTSLDRLSLGSELHVASPNEIRAIRNAMGRAWAVVTPGVRPAGGEHHDQSRVATPRAAVEAGADYLVVGRPITGAPDPARAAAAVLAEMRA